MSLSLIKLQDGTELIGDVTEVTLSEEDNSFVVFQVQDPLQINYKHVMTQPMPAVSISRYMPFAANTTFRFAIGDVTQVVEPKQTVIEYYNHALRNYREDIDRAIDRELMDVVGRSSIRSAENKEELYTALLERADIDGPIN